MSSAVQRERDTIASQLRVLPEYVQRQGWTLVRPPETYVDDGHSAAAGKLDRRTGLAALLRDAAAGAFDVVVVVDLDRLSRSEDLAERGAILGALQRAAVKIASTMTGQVLDLSTSSGDLLSSLATYFAAEWLRKHRERVTQGRITAAHRGRLPGGRRPWGHAYDPAIGVWSIDPVRGPLAAELCERAAAGESCRSLADDLEARAVPREGQRWHAGRVAAILRSRHLVGEWTADVRRGITVQVPPLVDVKLWERAQAAIASNRTSGLDRTAHDYLLLGVAVCGQCGGPIGIRAAKHYVCRGRMIARKGSEGRCVAPGVRVAAADELAWDAIRSELEDPELDRAIAGEVSARAADHRDWEADAAGYRGKLDRLQAAESALLARFTRGTVGEAALDVELARIARERTVLQAQLEACGRASTAVVASSECLREARAILGQLRERLAGAPFAVRRALVRQLVRPGGAVFDAEDIRITLRVPRPPAAAAHVDGSARGTGRSGCRASPGWGRTG